MGLNVGAVKKALVRLLDLLFESEDLVESVTYKLSTGVVSGTGRERNTSGYTDYTLSAINVEKNYARMLITDTGFSTAKLTYLLRTEGAPDGMSARDKIVCGTKVRQVLEVRNYFGVAYGLVLEGLQ